MAIVVNTNAASLASSNFLNLAPRLIIEPVAIVLVALFGYFLVNTKNAQNVILFCLFSLLGQKKGFENAHHWLFNSRKKMGLEKSQILGQAWAGLGPAQKRQERQPCHFCHVTPGPDLIHTLALCADEYFLTRVPCLSLSLSLSLCK